MLRIVYPTCCGLDVHKSSVFACIAATDENGVTTYQNRKFSTFTDQLKESGPPLQVVIVAPYKGAETKDH